MHDYTLETGLIGNQCKFYCRSSKGLEIGFDLGSSTFQKGWQGEAVSQIGNVFVQRETRTIGGQFKENMIWFAKVEALEIIAVDFSAVRYPQIFQSARPGVIGLLIRNSECDMMNAA